MRRVHNRTQFRLEYLYELGSAVSFMATFIMFAFRVLTESLQETVLYPLNYVVLQVF